MTQTVHSEVDILLTAAYALSRGFDVKELRKLGLIYEPPNIPDMSGSKK